MVALPAATVGLQTSRLFPTDERQDQCGSRRHLIRTGTSSLLFFLKCEAEMNQVEDHVAAAGIFSHRRGLVFISERPGPDRTAGRGEEMEAAGGWRGQSSWNHKQGATCPSIPTVRREGGVKGTLTPPVPEK